MHLRFAKALIFVKETSVSGRPAFYGFWRWPLQSLRPAERDPLIMKFLLSRR
jgi:hypothetical protein